MELYKSKKKTVQIGVAMERRGLIFVYLQSFVMINLHSHVIPTRYGSWGRRGEGYFSKSLSRASADPAAEGAVAAKPCDGTLEHRSIRHGEISRVIALPGETGMGRN